MIKIAIIGAGSAGMAMAKQILDVQKESKDHHQQIQFTIFERRKEVGGIWQFDENPKESSLGIEQDDGSISIKYFTKNDNHHRSRLIWKESWPPGAMFYGLRTNIPCDLMSFRDNLFPENTDLYPSRETVQDYLENYADQFNLRKHVLFSTNVERVIKDESTNGWKVTYKSILENESNESYSTKEEHFTHLVLAHGRCSTPNIPTIEGLQSFTGRIMHSAWYRDPTKLLQKDEPRRILIVGNASSGMDIARELSGFITRTLPCGFDPEQWKEQCQKEPFEVFSSWHSPDKPPPMDYNPLDNDSPEWCKRIKVVESISSIKGNKIHLSNGQMLEDIPLIIFATGFLFDNPFLDQSKGELKRFPLLPPFPKSFQNLGIPSQSIYNLDDWFLFHRKDDSLVMLGVPVTVVPFPFTEIQSMFVIQRWLKNVEKLPLLDCEISPTDETRWKSKRIESTINGNACTAEEEEIELQTTPHVFGKPSDSVYLNALLERLQPVYKSAGKQVPWFDEYKSDGKGNGNLKGPEDRFAISPWRIERRNAGRLLRREKLGY